MERSSPTTVATSIDVRSASARPARRARATLLWTLAFIVAGELLAGWLVDHPFRQYRLFELRSMVQDHCEQVRGKNYVLCLGSSRFAMGLRATELSPAWQPTFAETGVPILNLSSSAVSPVAMRGAFKELMATGAGVPRVALLEVSPETIGRKHSFWYIDSLRSLTAAEFIRSIPDNLGDPQLGRALAMRLSPAAGFRSCLRGGIEEACDRFGGNAPERRTQRFDPSVAAFGANIEVPPKPEATTAERTDDALRWLRRNLKNYRIGGELQRSFERLAASLSEHGAVTVLVVPPFIREHRNAYAELEADFQAELEGLRRKYGCLTVDCRDWIDDDLFADSHHLTREGSKRYCRLLIERVLRPQVLALPPRQP
jgi:hypothetical protein